MRITKMNEIIYVPIYIDGKEENLPKEEGYYFISTEDKYDINYDVFHFTKVNARQNKLDWMEHVVFWLKPTDLNALLDKLMPTEEEAEEYLKDTSWDAGYKFGFLRGVRWFRSRMKGDNK